jgi:hypothetical protein
MGFHRVPSFFNLPEQLINKPMQILSDSTLQGNFLVRNPKQITLAVASPLKISQLKKHLDEQARKFLTAMNNHEIKPDDFGGTIGDKIFLCKEAEIFVSEQFDR